MISSRDLFNLMVEMYRNAGVNCVLINDLEHEVTEIDQHFRERIEMHDWYNRVSHRFGNNMQPGDLCFYRDELQMNYTFFCPPAELEPDCQCHLLAMGPLLFDQASGYDIPAIMRTLGINSVYQQYITEFFNKAYLASGSKAWTNSLLFYLRRLCGDRPINIVQAVEEPEGLSLATDYIIPKDPDIAMTMVEDRYKAENALMQAISIGNYDQALDRCHEFLAHRLSPRSASPLRDKKNICFVFNTLMRKSAEFGGVHPLHVDNLSRQFAIQIEKALTVDQLTNLEYLMVRKYCLLVQNYARSNYPQLIQNCMNAIDFYYNAELSLSWLARHCNVSESHLSTTFKKETGMTVTEYINKTRVRQSLILLNTTALSIGEIASRCGFDDANYFSRIFRKIEGKSPKEYRTMIRG